MGLAVVAMVVGLLAGCAAGGTRATSTSKPTWAIAIHGGAGTIERSDDPAVAAAYRAALSRALDIGSQRLAEGATAMDAVEAVVRDLEDDALFNAGRGAALTRDGKAELDAAVMDGWTLSTGAVAGVTTVRHPVSLARAVMTGTKHVLLAGPGAERFADGTQLERVENEWFVTPRRKRMLEDALRKTADAGETTTPAARMGTVGAVALDSRGHLAAATSTGGVTGKLPGRVGDAPLIGAGTYANRVVAVSCTGTGEQFIRHTVAGGVASRMELLNEPVEKAAGHYIFNVLNPDDGGLIAIDAQGRIAMPYSSVGMYRGAADSNGRREVRIWKE